MKLPPLIPHIKPCRQRCPICYRDDLKPTRWGHRADHGIPTHTTDRITKNRCPMSAQPWDLMENL